MDLALGNLASLKAQLLAPALRSGTAYDAAIAAIGAGVARNFEDYCNRLFKRTAGEADQFSANRGMWIVRRLPLESVTKLERRAGGSQDWEELPLAETIQNFNPVPGIIEFGAALGSRLDQVRLTYTGGWWYETKEPADQGYPSTMPSGATPLPEDVTLAWHLQCAEIWDKRDRLGIGIVDKPEVRVQIGKMDYGSQVKRILDGMVRFQMT